MSIFNFNDHSHRRLNILTNEWMQVSPHRSKRPWQGKTEKVNEVQRPSYDPNCYLCPTNGRSSGEKNPDYKEPYAFTNDFPALQSDIPTGEQREGLFQYQAERGTCRVICFSPNHALTVPEMPVHDIKKVVDLWVKECHTLSKKDFVNYIQIFENKGAIMGCSNPHPHGQIWAQEHAPVELTKKHEQQIAYFAKNGKTILEDYIDAELKEDKRVIYKNDHFLVLVPFWACWPYEAMIIPVKAAQQIISMSEEQKLAFADAYQNLTIRYDNIFKTSFPYSAGIHQAAYDGKDYAGWHWHMSFYPPLLRSASVKKFMVGYEMFANPQRDITAEFAAKVLKDMPTRHYKQE